jgi:uncharacterized protein (UPF0276 family)
VSGVRGVGLGFRPELSHGLLRAPGTVDFLEVVAESLYARSDWKREALALAEVWPLVPHGVKLSLASAEGVDLERANKLGDLARELRAPIVSEHIALTKAGRFDIGHLTAVPFTREAVGVVARNVAATQRCLPDVPFLLENIAWTLRWPDDAMGEGEFHAEVVRATGCGMLLDVANVYANARNAGVDPIALVDSYPLDSVRMLHVAGGIFEDGFFFDTHAHDVPEEVFALVEHVLGKCGGVPIVLERDGRFPPFASIVSEVSRLRALGDAVGEPVEYEPVNRSLALAAVSDLSSRQIALAAALVSDGAATEFDRRAICRTRSVLNEKRIDDALPLLPRLSRRREQIEALVRARVPSWPRAETLVGPNDALRIVDAVVNDPELSSDALWDRLVLRARFAGDPVRPRASVFVGRERIGARTVWAFKGAGAGAPVKLWTTGGGSS